MKQTELTEQELKIWHLYKQTYKAIFGRIIKENLDQTGVSDGDFMVLDLLTRSETGEVRQQELAAGMGWSKSRLSHHLTRMEKRELIERRHLGIGNAIQVVITPKGTAAFDAVRPVSANGIKQYFIDLLTEQDMEWIVKLSDRVQAKIVEDADAAE